MSDLASFNPTSASELFEKIKTEIGGDLMSLAGEQRRMLERNLRTVAETTIDVRAALKAGELTAAQADSIMSQQESLINVTINSLKLFHIS